MWYPNNLRMDDLSHGGCFNEDMALCPSGISERCPGWYWKATGATGASGDPSGRRNTNSSPVYSWPGRSLEKNQETKTHFHFRLVMRATNDIIYYYYLYLKKKKKRTICFVTFDLTLTDGERKYVLQLTL